MLASEQLGRGRSTGRRQTVRRLWGDDPAEAAAKPEAGKGTAVVYLTDQGKKYHREGCRYLAKSSRATTLGEVPAAFGACSICSPPGR